MYLSHELITVATGAAPLAEVDVAIPLAISFGFSATKAYLLAFFGNILPLIPLLWFWRHGVAWLSIHSPLLKRFFEKIFIYTRSKHGKRVEFAGLTSLIILLMLPIPLAGAWTMTVLAFLFDFPFWKSFFAIVLGVALGALVVLGVTLGTLHFI